MSFSSKLRSLMFAKETQEEFAERVGVSPGSISHYLSGRVPRYDKIVQIVEKTGVSIDWLLFDKGPKFPDTSAKGSTKAPRMTDKRRAEFAASYWADMNKVAKNDRDSIMAMNIDMQSDPKLRTTLIEHYQFLSQKKKRKRK